MDVRVLKWADMAELRPYIGDELYAGLEKQRSTCAALPGGGLFLAFWAYDVSRNGGWGKSVRLYAGNGTVLMVTDDERCAELLHSQKAETPLEILHDFLEALIGDDTEALRKKEDAITALEDELLTPQRTGSPAGGSIITLRRQLLSAKRYYEQLSILSGDLAEIIEEQHPAGRHRPFLSLHRHTQWLLDFTMHLRESMTQVREAYQAQIDIEQNQTMKIFTVIAAVFLPLSLIVGWYGMNFPMPEYRWTAGYPFVIGLSAAVCVFCIWLFWKRRWF